MQASARHLAILAVEFDEPTLQPQKHVKDLSILVIHEARAKCGSSKIHPRLSACARQLSFCRGWTCARHELCSAITEIFISQGQISQKSSFYQCPKLGATLCYSLIPNKQTAMHNHHAQPEGHCYDAAPFFVGALTSKVVTLHLFPQFIVKLARELFLKSRPSM